MGNAVDWLKEQTVIGDVDEWVNEQTVVGDMTTWMNDQGMEWLQWAVPAVFASIYYPQLIPTVLSKAGTLASKVPIVGKTLAAPFELGAKGATMLSKGLGTGLEALGYSTPAGYIGSAIPEGAAAAQAAADAAYYGGATAEVPLAAGASGLGGTALGTTAAMEDIINNIDKGISDEAKNFKWYDEGLGQVVAANLISLPFSLMQAYGQAAIADQFSPGTSTQTRTTQTTFDKPVPKLSLPRYPTRTGQAAPSLEIGATQGKALPVAGSTARVQEPIPFQEDISEKILPRSQAKMAVNVVKSLMASAKTPEERDAIMGKANLLFAGLSNGQPPYRNKMGLG